MISTRTTTGHLAIDVDTLDWHKSTHSGDAGCVEVAFTDDGAFVRDTKDRFPVLAFTVAEWQAFVAGVRAGEFDL